jgi:glutamate synthase (NADPH/NADH) small chain
VPTGEEFTVEADTVAIAIGYGVEEEVSESAHVKHDKTQVVVDHETLETTRAGVFAGGDCVNGADLVVTAIADGRRAADAIHTYLTKRAEVAA